MIIVGGLGSVAGAVYGAVFIIAVPALLDELGNASAALIVPAAEPARDPADHLRPLDRAVSCFRAERARTYLATKQGLLPVMAISVLDAARRRRRGDTVKIRLSAGLLVLVVALAVAAAGFAREPPPSSSSAGSAT